MKTKIEHLDMHDAPCTTPATLDVHSARRELAEVVRACAVAIKGDAGAINLVRFDLIATIRLMLVNINNLTIAKATAEAGSEDAK